MSHKQTSYGVEKNLHHNFKQNKNSSVNQSIYQSVRRPTKDPRKILWYNCLDCHYNRRLVNGFCNLECIKKTLTKHSDLAFCQHPIRNEKRWIIGWKNDCDCDQIIEKIKSEILAHQISQNNSIFSPKPTCLPINQAKQVVLAEEKPIKFLNKDELFPEQSKFSENTVENKTISSSSYFDNYFLPLFLSLNTRIDKESSHFPTLSKQLKKNIKKHLQFHPFLFQNNHFYHTFKKPHTSSLIKWRKDLRNYLRKFFANNPHLSQQNLVILREFHQCHIECHWKRSKTGEHHSLKHCNCRNENNQFFKHLCKHDIHKTIISSQDLDFSSWKTKLNNGYYRETINPNNLCIDYDEESGKEISSLRHPVTGEVVNEMDKVLCYINKDAEDRFKYPQLYQRHNDNPNNVYFDTFSYLQDKSLRAWKKAYNQRYFQEKKEIIKSCFSNDREYERLQKAINRLEQKIYSSKSQKKKQSREKKRELIFQLTRHKKFLKNNVLPTLFLNSQSPAGELFKNNSASPPTIKDLPHCIKSNFPTTLSLTFPTKKTLKKTNNLTIMTKQNNKLELDYSNPDFWYNRTLSTNSKEWKDLRQVILVRDNHTCSFCHIKLSKWLTVDHIDGDGSNNDSNNLRLNCPACDRIRHCGLSGLKGEIVLVLSKLSQLEIVKLSHAFFISKNRIPLPKEIDKDCLLIEENIAPFQIAELRKQSSELQEKFQDYKGFFTEKMWMGYLRFEIK